MTDRENRARDEALATAGMAGGRFYDTHSSPQQRLVGAQHQLLKRLVMQIGPAEPEFRLVDYGCGPGQSAIETARPVIEAFRSMSATGPVAICHADQAGNDWNALFELVTGPKGYAAGDAAIRTEASVGSFYQSMAAPASVALGTCFTAHHWLSRSIQLESPGAIWFADLSGEARTELAALADADWTSFLRHRAKELRPGGYMVVCGLGSVGDDTEHTGVAATSRCLYRAVGRIAQDMAEEGRLDRRVLDRFVFPQWFRTAEETLGPLERVSDLHAAFEIEELSVRPPLEHPGDFFADKIGEPELYGELYAGLLRGFAHSTLMSGLLRPSSKSEPEAEALATELYRRVAQLYRNELGAHAGESWDLLLVLRRR